VRESKLSDAALVEQARSLASSWRLDLDLTTLIEKQLRQDENLDDTGSVDVVAIGKAAGEMASATGTVLADRVERALVICGDEGASSAPSGAEVLIGGHPLPDEGSLRAGARLMEFLSSSESATTILLISGGASSLCAAPAPPLSLLDLHAIFRSALERGVDITTLNRLRTATSLLGGGAVLRRVRSSASLSLIMVDNVVSGPEWVASGLTYEYRPTPDEVRHLIEVFGLAGGLAERITSASECRSREMRRSRPSAHVNRVVADPATMLASLEREATSRGFLVRSLGAAVHDDVNDAAHRWTAAVTETRRGSAPVCVIGVGEVTVNVDGEGLGGRCQQFALTMAPALAARDVDAVFVAVSSDGRDYVEGVAGAWADRTTMTRARALGVDVERVLADNDTHDVLARLGQLIGGAHTGWNLCDVYVALLRPPL
jgi:glycerate-2-kinase